MGIAVSINWLIVIAISYLPYFAHSKNDSDGKGQELQNLSIFFFMFSGFWMAGFFFISIYVKETKNLQPIEIIKLYKGDAYDPLSQN